MIAYTTTSLVNQAPDFVDVLALRAHERVCALRLLCYFRSGLIGQASSSWFGISPFIAPFVESLSPQTRPQGDRVLTQ